MFKVIDDGDFAIISGANGGVAFASSADGNINSVVGFGEVFNSSEIFVITGGADGEITVFFATSDVKIIAVAVRIGESVVDKITIKASPAGGLVGGLILAVARDGIARNSDSVASVDKGFVRSGSSDGASAAAGGAG